MKLYLDPIVEEWEDGTINVTLIKATPKNIDERIRNLGGFKKANFDIENIVEIVRNTGSSDEAAEMLRKEFKLTHPQANFMVNVTLDELSTCCAPKAWQNEIGKLKALKKLVMEE
jgi:DNA gyrase/topoisomerase IV subunit A